MSLIDHLEAHLGPIDRGWRDETPSGSIQVVRFRSQPVEGASAFVTLGVSRHVLPMETNREVRQELLLAAYDRHDSEALAWFLMQCATRLLSEHRALLRGETATFRGKPIIAGVPMTAVYASIPVTFPESFWTYRETSPPTVLVWLLPLRGEENAYVLSHGWGAFEDLLETNDPDLLDLGRPSIAHPPSE